MEDKYETLRKSVIFLEESKVAQKSKFLEISEEF